MPTERPYGRIKAFAASFIAMPKIDIMPRALEAGVGIRRRIAARYLMREHALTVREVRQVKIIVNDNLVPGSSGNLVLGHVEYSDPKTAHLNAGSIFSRFQNIKPVNWLERRILKQAIAVSASVTLMHELTHVADFIRGRLSTKLAQAMNISNSHLTEALMVIINKLTQTKFLPPVIRTIVRIIALPVALRATNALSNIIYSIDPIERIARRKVDNNPSQIERYRRMVKVN